MSTPEEVATRHAQTVANQLIEQGITREQLTDDMLISMLTPEMLNEACIAAARKSLEEVAKEMLNTAY